MQPSLRTAVLATTLFVPAMGLVGCDSTVNIIDLPDETASVWCDLISTCNGELAVLGGAFAPGSCDTAVSGAFDQGQIVIWGEAITRGTAGYDASSAAACLEESRALGCDLFIAADAPACRTILVGAILLGSPCSIGLECEGDAYCEAASCPMTSGICQARKASGVPCASRVECMDGLVCENGACGAVQSRSGGPCGGAGDLACPLGESCEGDVPGGTMGACEPVSRAQTVALGQPCSIEEGSALLCVPGLSCAVTGLAGMAANFECVERVSASERCNLAFPAMCPAGLECDADPFSLAFEGDCVPLPLEGAPCSMGVPQCADGLLCIDTGDGEMCVRQKNNGESCSVASECHSTICESGVCRAPQLCPAG